MKNLIKSIFLFVGVISLVGCNENDPNDGKFGSDKQSGWVQFAEQNKTYIVSGLVTEIDVPFNLVSTLNTDGLLVNYTVTPVSGTLPAGYLTYSGVTEVPRNTLNGNIRFTIPTTELSNCAEVVITLTGTSRNNVTVGLNNGTEKPITHNLVFGKGISSYLGNYIIQETSDDVYTYPSTVTAGDEPNELVVSSVYGVSPTTKTSIFLQPVGNSPMVILPPATDNFFLNDSGTNIYVNGDVDTSEFQNSYDPCTNQSVFYFFFSDAAGDEIGIGSPTGPIEIILNKQ